MDQGSRGAPLPSNARKDLRTKPRAPRSLTTPLPVLLATAASLMLGACASLGTGPPSSETQSGGLSSGPSPRVSATATGPTGSASSGGSPTPATASATAGSAVLQELAVPFAHDRTLQLTIADKSGRLAKARATTEEEWPRPSDAAGSERSGFPAIFAWNGNDARELHLVWNGWVCEKTALLTIGAGVSAISVELGPRPSSPCDAMAVSMAVLLEFDRPVDAHAISLSATDPYR